MPWCVGVSVVIGIVVNQNNHFLITKRSKKDSYAGYWEFPGGKIESNESASDALIRELNEEVGIVVLSHAFLGEMVYEYPLYSVHLIIHHVSAFDGEAYCNEDQQDLRWVPFEELNQFDFLPANTEIIALIARSEIVANR